MINVSAVRNDPWRPFASTLSIGIDGETAFIDIAAPLRRGRLLFHVAVALLFLGLVALNFDHTTGFTRLIGFGDRFAPAQLPDVAQSHPFVFPHSDGYDGQFYAQVATRPTLADPALKAALDRPDYRSRRIGLPWFAWLVGVGHTPWVLEVYALTNVLAWLALAGLLLRWIAPANATALAAWFGAVFGVGTIMSVARALTDLPSTLLIAVAILFAERARQAGAVVSLALAALTRDTSVLAGGLLLPPRLDDRRGWIRASLLAIFAVVPVTLWALYAHWRFPDSPQVDGSNFDWPFVAMLGALDAAWRVVPQKGWHIFIAQLFTTAGLCAQFLFLAFSLRGHGRERWWRAGAPFALLFVVLGPAVWEDASAAARAVLPMTLAFNILLPRDRRWSLPLCLLGNLSVLHGLAYLLPTTWKNLP